jgi:uncharacterized protein YijF (DUF1287 family)
LKSLFLKTILLFVSYFPLFGQEDFYKQFADSALTLTRQDVDYDPSYFILDYPNGDVPEGKGVCTDVVIRAYRKFGIDLQKEVHEDMLDDFDRYPKIWGLSEPDKNIDHRRVPNLMTFFEKNGTSLQLSQKSSDYLPGDIVCWNLGGGLTHIGIVSHQKAIDEETHLIIHNIGRGQVVENILFEFKIIGHYRYFSPSSGSPSR